MFDIVGVLLQISKHAGSQKNPKVLAESLNWLSDAIKGFGFKYKSMIFLFSFLNELLVLNRKKKSSSPHCTLKHCTKIAFKREHMFTVFVLSFVPCDFIGSLCHISMKCNLFCCRNQSMISCIKEKIFNAQGDAYLSDETSHASCSCQIACRKLALNVTWICASSKIIFLDTTGYAYFSDAAGHTLPVTQHGDDHNNPLFC